jgi:hypothetical protein
MEARNSELPPQPPGAVNALIRGFNAVTNNISVILFPIVLDVFLWLGPRLRMKDLLESAFQFIKEMQQPSEQMASFSQFADEIAKGFSLFSNLRTYPLGIFSLMVANLSATSPLGARINLDISNWFIALAINLLLVFIGCLIGSLYFYFVSRAALKPEKGPGLPRALFHSVLLAIIWQFVFIGIAPFVLILLALPNTFIGILLFLLLAWPITWIALMIFFSTHPVFTQSKNAFTSVFQNFRVLRYGMPPMGWFALMAVVISHGMDLLWLLPSAESWMTLLGIFGHAFISTGLLSASFIFYRDLSAWVDDALAWVKSHQITSARV